MAKEITQRQLRNDSGDVMRALDAGNSFILTRNGVPVGELSPVRQRGFVARDVVREAFVSASSIDFQRLRADLDSLVDQDPTPHG